jgi:olfactory receptor
MSSTEGSFKAFSTCSFHIIAVSLFFESGVFIYLKPSSTDSVDKRKISFVSYTTALPVTNPLIYSLRNKDVKVALRKTLSRRSFWSETLCCNYRHREILCV